MMTDTSSNFYNGFNPSNEFAPIYSPPKAPLFAPFEEISETASPGFDLTGISPNPETIRSSHSQQCKPSISNEKLDDRIVPKADAVFFLCVNCGKWCSNPVEMKEHKQISKHLGFLRADFSDNFECFVCKKTLCSIQLVLNHILQTEHDQFQKIRVVSSSTTTSTSSANSIARKPVVAAISGTAMDPTNTTGEFICASCGHLAMTVEDVTVHSKQSGHMQFKASNANSAILSSAIAISKPQPFTSKFHHVLLRPEEQNTMLQVCLSCTQWFESDASRSNHLSTTGHANYLPVKHKGSKTSYKCTTCGDVFTQPEMVGEHIKAMRHHKYVQMYNENVRFHCCACQLSFNNQSEAQAHSINSGHEKFVGTSEVPEDKPIPFICVSVVAQSGFHVAVLLVSLSNDLSRAVDAVKAVEQGASSGLGFPHDIFLCTACSLRFGSEEGLSEHCRQQHLTSEGVFNAEVAELRMETGAFDVANGKRSISASFYCIICHDAIPRPKKYSKHIKECHLKKCPGCSDNVLMLDKSSMKAHYKSAKCLTRCPECCLVFPDSFELRMHQNKGCRNRKPVTKNANCHQDFVYRCRRCRNEFDTIELLRHHKESSQCVKGPSSEPAKRRRLSNNIPSTSVT